jgi:hypothetical protein
VCRRPRFKDVMQEQREGYKNLRMSHPLTK